MDDKQNQLPFIRAAQYVRMSTEHQQYSTDNQADIIREFALKHGMEIVKTYADEGKSGLNLEGRDSLKQMFDDVTSGNAGYEVILVYDISRWGRFQDIDQSAYHEYICRKNNIRVEYCAEQFQNDGSISSNIMKAVKRGMAGEYSRELSKKVFIGQCRLINLGYRQGGMAGFGLRRMLVNTAGTPLRILKLGERKSLQTERVILVPGPAEEVEVVQWIYDQFVNHGKKESEIAKALNDRGILTDLAREYRDRDEAATEATEAAEAENINRPWNRGIVNEILTNEKYIGNNIYNRRSFKLKQKHVTNPPDMWVRADAVFDAIVDPKLFYTAQGIIQERNHRYTNEDMLELLKQLYRSKGVLSGLIIDEAENLPTSSLYHSRFGSLVRAYKLVGYTPATDYGYLEINKRIREMHPGVVKDVISQIEAMGGRIHRDQKTDLLTINQEFSTSLVISRCNYTAKGSSRWIIRLDTSLKPDITVAARMDSDNEKIQDYYLLPSLDITGPRVLRLSQHNGIALDAYRFDTLDFFFSLAKRIPIWTAA